MANGKDISQEVVCSIIETPFPIIEANVIVDDVNNKIVLPILLISFLISGDITEDKFRNAFR
jgi:hypothetical protein